MWTYACRRSGPSRAPSSSRNLIRAVIESESRTKMEAIHLDEERLPVTLGYLAFRYSLLAGLCTRIERCATA
jgi:hypothetical protein